MWITRNLLVFQNEFKYFLATKVAIFMVEWMLAICSQGIFNKRMTRIMRTHRYVHTPIDRRIELGITGSEFAC